MHYKNQIGIRKTTTLLQVVLLAVAIVNVIIVSNSVENKQGLSATNKIVSWTISSNIYNLSLIYINLFYNTKFIIFFLSFINVFNQKNFRSLIEHNSSILVDWHSLCSTIIEHGSVICACASNDTSMLEKNRNTIYGIQSILMDSVQTRIIFCKQNTKLSI